MGLLTGVRVLLVDDDREQLEIMARVLVQAGARVSAAITAQEAIESFQLQPPDAVVSDVAMPGTTGFTLIRVLRSMPHGRTVPAIAVSGLAWEDHRALAIEAGFDEWVSKPAVDSLIDVVARATRRSP